MDAHRIRQSLALQTMSTYPQTQTQLGADSVDKQCINCVRKNTTVCAFYFLDTPHIVPTLTTTISKASQTNSLSKGNV